MSAISVLTLKEPIVPIVLTIDHNLERTVKIKHRYQETYPSNVRAWHRTKMFLPVCDNPSEKELFLYAILQFMDAIEDVCLHLDQGKDRYMKFCEVVGINFCLEWQLISAQHPVKTTDTFGTDIRNLLQFYFSESLFKDQKEYMCTATKPVNMTCEALASRLCVISGLCHWLPGSAGNELYPQNNDKKCAYFMMMPGS